MGSPSQKISEKLASNLNKTSIADHTENIVKDIYIVVMEQTMASYTPTRDMVGGNDTIDTANEAARHWFNNRDTELPKPERYSERTFTDACLTILAEFLEGMIIKLIVEKHKYTCRTPIEPASTQLETPASTQPPSSERNRV